MSYYGAHHDYQFVIALSRISAVLNPLLFYFGIKRVTPILFVWSLTPVPAAKVCSLPAALSKLIAQSDWTNRALRRS